MRKLLLVALLSSVLTCSFLKAPDAFLTSPAMDAQADPVNAQALAGDATKLSQFFQTHGPLGNFALKVGIENSESKTDNFGGFVRVDPETRQMYTVSKINPDKPVDEKRASRFQAIFLSEYEIKLFRLQPKLQDKKNLAKASDSAEHTAASTKFNNAILSYNDMAKEDLSLEESGLLVTEFAKLIKLITSGESDEDKTAYTNFVSSSGKSVDSLILALQEINKDQKTAEAFVNAVKSWDFGYSTKVAGAPANADIVVIYSQSAQKYFSVTKDKGVGGADVFYLAPTSDDPIGATQFKVQEVGGRLGLTCQSEIAMNMALRAPPPDVTSDIESVKRRMTRLMLSARPEKSFGQPGTEDEQFQISGSEGNFYLRCSAVEASDKGFLTVDSTDNNFVRVYDNSKEPLAKKEVTSQQFKFVVISKSKAFYDSLSKARAEKNPGARLEIYADLIGSVASLENGQILLEEVERFVMANKASAGQWADFKEGVAPGVEVLIEEFNKTFESEIEGSEKLTAARDALVKTLTEPFVTKLEDGFYAIAWVNSAGEKKFLQLVNEEKMAANYDKQFKISAIGTDILSPTAMFKLQINTEAKTLQIESEYKKDAVLGETDRFTGPNDALAEGEAPYSAVKVVDQSKGTATKYLRVIGWREHSDVAKSAKEEQGVFTFTFEGAGDNMHFKNIATKGYLTVNPTNFSVRTLDDSDEPLSKPGTNSRFALVKLSDEQVEMASTRAKSISDQIDFYLKSAQAVDAKTPKSAREELIAEIDKFIRQVVSSPDKYLQAKANSDKINQLMGTIVSDAVSVYKTIGDKTKKIKASWDGGFAGPVENDQWYVFSWTDPAGQAKILKLEKVTNEEYQFKAVNKAGPQDELSPMSRLKATVFPNGNVQFETSIDGGLYTLIVKDNPAATGKKRLGVVAAEDSDLVDDRNEFVPMTNDDGTVSFNSLKEGCGFMTVDSSGLVSTLSELTKKASGLAGQDGELAPGPGAKFAKTMLTDFHTGLSEIRSIKDDLARLAKYLEKANYKDVTPEQLEALAGELVAWVTKITGEKARYKTLSANKAFSGQLNSLMDGVIGKLPESSKAKTALSDAKNLWSGGFVGTRHAALPEAGKKIILQATEAVDGIMHFLRAVKDEDSGKIVLRADSESPLDSGSVLEVMLKGERVGLKSTANDGKVMMAPSLPSDAAEWTPRRKKIETALHFVPADQAKFNETAATGSQFILPATSTKETASFQTVPNESDDPLKTVVQGFISLKGDDKTARVLDPGTLAPHAQTIDGLSAKEKFKIIVVNSVYNQALELIKESDNEKLVSGFKTMARQVKPGTTDKDLFLHAFKQAVTTKTDIALSEKIKDLIVRVKEEWGKKYTATDDAALNDALKVMFEKSLDKLIEAGDKAKMMEAFTSIVDQVKDINIDRSFFATSFDKAFKDKRDFKLSQQAEELLTKAKAAWGDKYTTELDTKLQATVATMLLLGSNFSDMIAASAREVIQTPREGRAEAIKKLVDDKLSNWEEALLTGWTDEQIQTDLKLDKADTKRTPARTITERINALRTLLKALKPLSKMDRSNASGINDLYSKIRGQSGKLSRDLKDARRGILPKKEEPEPEPASEPAPTSTTPAPDPATTPASTTTTPAPTTPASTPTPAPATPTTGTTPPAGTPATP